MEPEDNKQQIIDDETLNEERGDFFEGSDDDPEATSEKEPDPDPAPEDEPEDEPKEVEPEEPKPEKKQAVPYDRFNAVNEQKKLLEQQNEMLRQMLADKNPPPEQKPDDQAPDDATQLRALRKELKEALYSDDEAKYEEVQSKIDQINDRRNRAIIRAEMEASNQARAEQDTTRQILSVADEMVKLYPILDTKGGNPDAITKVVALRDYYATHENLSMPDALRKAATEIGELYSTKAPEDPKPSTDPRKTAAIARGVKESNEQPLPTSQAGVGARAQAARLNPDRMSEREFSSLPEEERARLRGDSV